MPIDPPFSNYEHELYVAGMLAGRKPSRPVDWRELERDAYAMLPRGPRGYIQGGAGRGKTIGANREAFDEWRIVPRMLRDVSERSLERTVLGTRLPAPVLLAPIGVQTVAH
ncbi:MAG: alpha-hydroxy-acid oxidizing protein, partial [Solirubrobacteraceae bacterium]